MTAGCPDQSEFWPWAISEIGRFTFIEGRRVFLIEKMAFFGENLEWSSNLSRYVWLDFFDVKWTFRYV